MMASVPGTSMFRSVLAMQCCHLRASVAMFAGLVLVLVMMGVAVGTLGWLQSAVDAVRFVWLLLPPVIFMHYYILIHQDQARSDYFRAMGYGVMYRAVQACLLWVSLLPLFAIVGCLALYFGGKCDMMFAQAGLMQLFVVSTFGALYMVRHLIEAYRLSFLLYMTIAGPWCLVTWVVAMIGGLGLFDGGEVWLSVAVQGMAALWWPICGMVMRKTENKVSRTADAAKTRVSS